MENSYIATHNQAWVPSRKERVLAWSAHFFTATGAVWALLALLSITNQQWIWAFTWMAAAVAVDSLDGILARRARVKEVLPEFDGALLDNIIDFLNYVVVPAFFLYQADFLPPRFALGASALVLLASSYQFCQNNAKTPDHFFQGFPSYWNIMVYYIFILGLNGWINLALIMLLSALVFVPIKYIYPSRTILYQRLTLLLAAIWGVVNIIIIIQYPTQNPSPWLIALSLAYVAYYSLMSLYMTFSTR